VSVGGHIVVSVANVFDAVDFLRSVDVCVAAGILPLLPPMSLQLLILQLICASPVKASLFPTLSDA
jgi:hypothetical protein